MSDSLQPHGLYGLYNSLGQNTGVGSLSFLKGIFPTRGSNPGLPHCSQILYQLSHRGSPILTRLCSKSFKLGFSSMWIKNFQIYKLGLEKAEEPGIKLPIFAGSWRKQGDFRKTSTSASLTTLKSLIVWITTNCGTFFKRWEYQTTLPVSWKTFMQVKTQQLEPGMQ